jgi:hypothetical protein
MKVIAVVVRWIDATWIAGVTNGFVEIDDFDDVLRSDPSVDPIALRIGCRVAEAPNQRSSRWSECAQQNVQTGTAQTRDNALEASDDLGRGSGWGLADVVGAL